MGHPLLQIFSYFALFEEKTQAYIYFSLFKQKIRIF